MWKGSLWSVSTLPCQSQQVCGCVMWLCFSLCIIDVWHIGQPSLHLFPHTLTSATHTPGWVYLLYKSNFTSPSHIVLITTTIIIIITMIITTILVFAVISSSPSSLTSPHFCSYGCSSSPLIGKSSCHLWRHIDIIAHSADFWPVVCSRIEFLTWTFSSTWNLGVACTSLFLEKGWAEFSQIR